ncbi:MAG TPA: hypothetical protein VGL70_22640 [Candidatus Binatia bacterium]|jgi:hypothetical protein
MQRVLSILTLIGALSFPAEPLWPNNHWATLLPDGDGKEETRQLCGSCHNLQKTVLSRKTPQEWERTVFDMVARGAQIFPDEAEKISKYLSASFPPGKATGQ